MDDFTNPGIKQVVPKVETHNLQIRSPLYDGMEADSHTSFAFTWPTIHLEFFSLKLWMIRRSSLIPVQKKKATSERAVGPSWKSRAESCWTTH